jgi:methanol metabolism-related c-type cytochrome
VPSEGLGALSGAIRATALLAAARRHVPARLATRRHSGRTGRRRVAAKEQPMRNRTAFVFAVSLLAASALVLWTGAVRADGPGDSAAVKTEDGKSFDKEGNPTYRIAQDGTVDWYTYSGFRRYHSECHVCHGPNGDGSSFAPALKDSLKRISYGDFLGIVAGGRKNVTTAQENVMPAFGQNPNVMCYLDDIYVYLRARSNDAVGRVRPEKHEDKSQAFAKSEDACMSRPAR